MKIYTVLIATIVSLASISMTSLAKADTVDARCDFYPIGEDSASSWGSCTFSQRQGYITIRTPDGRVYEFSPVGDQPGNFVDASGNPVYRESGLGDAGQIFRLADESIFVYWETASEGEPASSVEYGETVPALSDLVGARAGQAENELRERGYEWQNASQSEDSSYSNWTELETGNCVTIRTTDGRYASIVYVPTADCDR
jgi:hypothetical protein